MEDDRNWGISIDRAETEWPEFAISLWQPASGRRMDGTVIDAGQNVHIEVRSSPPEVPAMVARQLVWAAYHALRPHLRDGKPVVHEVILANWLPCELGAAYADEALKALLPQAHVGTSGGRLGRWRVDVTDLEESVTGGCLGFVALVHSQFGLGIAGHVIHRETGPALVQRLTRNDCMLPDALARHLLRQVHCAYWPDVHGYGGHGIITSIGLDGFLQHHPDRRTKAIADLLQRAIRTLQP